MKTDLKGTAVAAAEMLFQGKKKKDGIRRWYKQITKLHDDILIYVFPRSTIKEAAKTSIFSGTWRYLWTYFAGSLDLNDVIDMRTLCSPRGCN